MLTVNCGNLVLKKKGLIRMNLEVCYWEPVDDHKDGYFKPGTMCMTFQCGVCGEPCDGPEIYCNPNVENDWACHVCGPEKPSLFRRVDNIKVCGNEEI